MQFVVHQPRNVGIPFASTECSHKHTMWITAFVLVAFGTLVTLCATYIPGPPYNTVLLVTGVVIIVAGVVPCGVVLYRKYLSTHASEEDDAEKTGNIDLTKPDPEVDIRGGGSASVAEETDAMF